MAERISQIVIFQKKTSLNMYQSPQFSIFFFTILTAGNLDYFYVKLVWVFRIWHFVIFIHNFTKFLRKNKINIHKMKKNIENCGL